MRNIGAPRPKYLYVGHRSRIPIVASVIVAGLGALASGCGGAPVVRPEAPTVEGRATACRARVVEAPDDHAAHACYREAMARLGRLDVAIESLAAARDAAPDEPLRTYFHARARLEEDVDAAAVLFESCRAASPACAVGASLAALRSEQPMVAARLSADLGDAEGLAVHARALIEAGDLDRGRPAAEAALRAGPSDPAALVAHARAEIERGAGAWGSLARAVAEAPDDPAPWATRAIAWRRSGNDAEAVRDLEAALTRSPRRVDLRWELARTLAVAGRPETAVAHLDRLVTRFPDRPPYQVALADALLRSGATARALDVTAQRLAVAADDPDALLVHARALVASGRVDEALALRPRLYTAETARPWLVLAEALGLAGQANLAESELAAAVAERPNDIDGWLAYAFHSARRGRFQRAGAALRYGLELHPESSRLHAELGRLREAQGNPRDARAFYEKAARLDPDDPDPADEAARLRHATGDAHGAVDDWRAVLAAHPRAYRARMRLAGALYQLKRPAEAVTVLRALRAGRPGDVAVAELFARSLLAAGQAAEAADALEDAEVPELRIVRGHALAALGRTHEAEAAFRSVLELDPTRRTVRLALARLLAKEKRDTEALALVVRQLNRDPRDAEALALLMDVAGHGRASLILADLPGSRAAEVEPALAALAERAGEGAGDAATVLRDERYVTVDARGVATVRHVRSVLLRSREGVARYGRVALPFHAHRAPTVIRARTLTPDGAVISVSEAGRQVREVDAEGTLRGEARRLVLEFPQVEPGALVDYEVVVHRPHPSLSGLWWDGYVLANPDPTVRAVYELTLPVDAKVRFEAPGLAAPSVTQHEGGRSLRWTGHELPSFAAEAELLPGVYASSFPSWEAVDAWYHALYAPRATPTPPVVTRAQALTAGRRTAREKLAALLTFVERHVRYLGIEFGIGAYQPRPAESTLASGAGDCKDMTALLQAMLASVGIESHPALVRPRGQGGFVRQLPSPAQFSHVVLYVPAADAWVDLTAGLGTVDAVPELLRGQHALVVDGSGGAIIRIPEADAARHGRRERTVWRVSASGAGRIESRVELRGDAAGKARTRLLRVDDAGRQAMLAAPGVLLGNKRVPTHVTASGLNDPDAPLVLLAQGADDDLVGVRLDGALLLPPAPMRLEAQIDEDTTLTELRSFERELRVELPDGYRPTWTPLRFQEDGPPVAIRIEETRADAAVVFRVTAVVKSQARDAHAVHRFRAAMQRANAAMMQDLLIEPGAAFDRLAFLRKIAVDHPDDAHVMSVLGHELLAADALPAARDAFERAVAADAALMPARFLLGLTQYRLGEHADAEATWRALMKLEGHPPRVHARLAQLLLDTERAAEAATEMRAAVAEHPDARELRLMWVHALRRTGDKVASLAAARQSAEALPGDGDAQALLGDIAAWSSERALAVEAYRAALAAAPDDPRLLNNLAWTLRHDDETLAEGIELVERALALRPDSAAAWDTLAELRFRNGEPQLAIEAIDEAEAVNPDERARYEAQRRRYRGDQ